MGSERNKASQIGKQILAVLLVLAGILTTTSLQAREPKGPRIEVEQERFDAGTVKAGTPISHVFKIRNAGDEPLLIDRVQPSGGCTAAVISSDHLEPGIEGQIKATVDTAGRAGRLEKFITVYTNDPVRPEVTLMLTLNVVRN